MSVAKESLSFYRRMLTAKQARFVDEYLIDLNATQAAIRAGYSQKNAQKISSELLGKSKIAAAIDAAKSARSKRVGANSDFVLQRLFEEVNADLADLFDEKNNLKPVEKWPPIWRNGLVIGVDTEALFDGFGKGRKQIGTVQKVRLSDRVRRLELLGKHVRVNAFQDNVHHTGVNGLGDRLDRAIKRLTEDRRTTTDKRAATETPRRRIERAPRRCRLARG